ncbi:hypothetical protein KJ996_06310, partial [Patescibacteria group bacterium]|nr:hypothetical protein [Patescibacteria group bacterium]
QQGFEVAWLEALKGNLYAAMNLSAAVGGASVITDKKILAASIDGGRKIMLSHSKNKPFKTMNGGVMVCEKPKRIYKISDFLSLPRASGYSIHSR